MDFWSRWHSRGYLRILTFYNGYNSEKKKTLTFSEFKVCLRSYEETEHMCYPHPMNLIIYYKWRPHLKRLTQGINPG